MTIHVNVTYDSGSVRAEAEKFRPAGNDDSILRWNRCARLLESRPEFHAQHPGPNEFETADTPPVNRPLHRAAK